MRSGEQNSRGRQFCRSCGSPVVDELARFCHNCGDPLYASAPGTDTVVTGLQGPPRVGASGYHGPRLRVDWPGGSGYWAIDRPVLTIGREASCDIVIDYPTVSRRHARLEHVENRFRLIDLGSTNGLTWRGRRLPQIDLAPGEVVSIGDGIGNSVSLRIDDERVASLSSVPDTAVALRRKRVVTIGRAKDNDLILDHPAVSAYHARVTFENGETVLEDLQSTNRSLVNGRPVTGKCRIAAGDLIQVGPLGIEFDGTALRVLGGRGGGFRPGQRGETGVLSLPAGRMEMTIGRDPGCDLCLFHPSVSRKHARLTRQNDKYVIWDLNSLNGVFVNEKRVFRYSVLCEGDRVRFGQSVLVFKPNATPKAASYSGGMQIEGHGLFRRVPCEAKGLREALQFLAYRVLGLSRTKIILHNVNITIQPNEFVALVGGSGSGKTTLLTALGGVYRPTGSVLIDGKDLYAHADELRPFIGYVPQADIIHHALTVERSLDYVARLRLPDLSAAERRARINEVLEAVDMQACRAQAVGRLSGGQRKRVSTAVELLASPKVLLLDEPTSGLDPGLDKRLMYTFRQLADGGRTVVIVTHATSNIAQCHKLAFLAPGGRLAYYGPPDKALEYFGVEDLASIYTYVENDPRGYEKRFAASKECQEYIVRARLPVASSRQSTSTTSRRYRRRLDIAEMFRQYLILTQRYVELLLRDIRNMSILLAQAPLIGVLLFLVSSKNVFPNLGQGTDPQTVLATALSAQTVCYVLANVALWFGVINAVREIAKESAIYRRERLANLGIVPYVFSKLTVLAGLSIFQAIVLLCLVLSKTGLPSSGILFGGVLDVLITLFLTSFAALGMSLVVSASVENEDRAMSWVPIVLLPQLILAGVSFKLSGISAQLSKLMISYWSTLSLGSIVGICNSVTPCPNDRIYLDYRHETAYLLKSWGVMGLMALIFVFVVIFKLRSKDAA